MKREIINWKNNIKEKEKKELEKNGNLKTLGFSYIGKDRGTRQYRRGNLWCSVGDNVYRFDTVEDMRRRQRELYKPTTRR